MRLWRCRARACLARPPAQVAVLLRKSPGQAPERPPVDGVAYTAGPGLIGALLVGAAVGRSLAYAWRVPALGVHHLEAHLLAPLLRARAAAIPVSRAARIRAGTRCSSRSRPRPLSDPGQSLDDAAGEAFDKTAKLLGLGLPGGPQLAALALRGRPGCFRFPRPLTDRPGLDFSFSGLKTAVVVAIRGRTLDEQARADVARAFEDAVVDTLAIKCAARTRSHGGRARSSSRVASARTSGCARAFRRWVPTAGRGSYFRAPSSAQTMRR